MGPEVRMTVEEYLQLIANAETPSVIRKLEGARKAKKIRVSRKKSGKAAKGMARALKKANAKARKKDGSFRKGYDQARVMREAHKIRRKGL